MFENLFDDGSKPSWLRYLAAKWKRKHHIFLYFGIGYVFSSFSFLQMRKDVFKSEVICPGPCEVVGLGFLPVLPARAALSHKSLEDCKLAVWDDGFGLLWTLGLDETHLIHCLDQGAELYPRSTQAE